MRSTTRPVPAFLALACLAAGCGASAVKHEPPAPAVPVGPPASIPLTVDSLDVTPLMPRLYDLGNDAVGRFVRNRKGWMAVEQYFGMIEDRPGEQLSYAQMLELDAQGEITEATVVVLGFRRALVEGDSARVADAVARGQVNWHTDLTCDVAPKNPIIPVDEGSDSEVGSGTPGVGAPKDEER